MEYEAVQEVVPDLIEAVTEPGEPPGCSGAGRDGGLDLDGDDESIGRFEYQVDLRSPVIAKVVETRFGLVPGELFGHLVDHERFDQPADGRIGGTSQRSRDLLLMWESTGSDLGSLKDR